MHSTAAGHDRDHTVVMQAIDNNPAASVMLVSHGLSFRLFELICWLDWIVANMVLFTFGIDHTGRTFVGELLHHLQSVVISADGWSFLAYDIGVFQAYDQAKLHVSLDKLVCEPLENIFSVRYQRCVSTKSKMSQNCQG